MTTATEIMLRQHHHSERIRRIVECYNNYFQAITIPIFYALIFAEDIDEEGCGSVFNYWRFCYNESYDEGKADAEGDAG